MIKYLATDGNNDVLVISKEMQAHLGLADGRVQVEYYGGRIIVTKPPAKNQEEDPILDQYLDAYRSLHLHRE